MSSLRKIKVLIVDDSYFMRRLIADFLANEIDIEVIGEAKDGREAVAMALKLDPDVITLDYSMPGMSGLDVLNKIMKESHRPPAVIMLSSVTGEGAELTFECLSAGAVDFVTKPIDEVMADIDSISVELVRKIRIASMARLKQDGLASICQSASGRKHISGATRLVVIGSSTGGPPVVEKILASLPPYLNMILLVVQHMPEKFTHTFADRLDRITSYKVKEVEEADVLDPGICLVARGGFHLVLSQDEHDQRIKRAHLSMAQPFFGLRPSINTTMKSAAEIYGAETIGIILTGMGEDGTEGARELKCRGGLVMVQSPETAVINSMPKSVIDEGLADEILSPEEIVSRLAVLCG